VAPGAVLYGVEYEYRRHFPKVKRSGLEVSYPPLRHAEVKIEWSLSLYACIVWTGTYFN
jgi:hypothetical protein